ncbi:MAG: hypothetical protein AUI36_08110 [Cyanobacteria bacterium 13_1_40CM_2_61_4]|nr:MAG: hypothetical protein AUI36_08110 [Cyanobacteria bacterium 13_1_40CM_2_61_4]
MRREVDETLKRLDTDHIDLLQLHEPDPNTPIEESWSEMQRLIRTGKVRHGGLSNHPPELMQRALRIGSVVSSQNQFNPFRRKAEKEIFPFCLANGIGVLSWGSLSEGVLADGFDLNRLDPNDFRRRQFYALPENREKVDRVREVFRRIALSRGKRMVDIVVAWELTHSALTGIIIGVRNENEAREMTRGADLNLSRDEMAMINDTLNTWE